MTAAASKVFGTAELREAILLELPPRDLLLAQRVNTAFKETIHRSVHIQVKLFFTSNEARHGEETGMVTINPFLPRLLSLMKHARFEPVFEPWESETKICHRGRDLYLPDMSDKTSGSVYCCEAKWPISICLDPGAEPMVMPQGSWRKMLASDPPTFRFVVYTDPGLACGVTPVTMGDFIDEAFHFMLLTG